MYAGVRKISAVEISIFRGGKITTVPILGTWFRTERVRKPSIRTFGIGRISKPFMAFEPARILDIAF